MDWLHDPSGCMKKAVIPGLVSATFALIVINVTNYKVRIATGINLSYTDYHVSLYLFYQTLETFMSFKETEQPLDLSSASSSEQSDTLSNYIQPVPPLQNNNNSNNLDLS